ncbi:hypothetical protein Bca52824_040081 [Brassica carinata]|uniref:Uncharacterized protein n=1 Tax=Brassica carinata TaxID=52824 RepID=A0A8X7RSR4_BRACI|nr:hypothetical protein Bca52824_040081 [Brassica carinata]
MSSFRFALFLHLYKTSGYTLIHPETLTSIEEAGAMAMKPNGKSPSPPETRLCILQVGAEWWSLGSQDETFKYLERALW